MVHSHHPAHRHQLSRRENVGSLPTRTEMMEKSKVIVARSTCTNDSDAGCKKPTVVPTLPIIIGVVVPIVVLAAVLLYLHRRHQRNLRAEDAKDKYKSLDFGIDPAVGGTGKKNRKVPEMTVTDMEKAGGRSAHQKGMSLDIDVAGPYILPAGLHGSRESLHSLSRSTHDVDDPYRPVTFIQNDAASVRSGNRPYKHDNGSLHTTSSGGTERNRMNDGLLKNAQRMSRSAPLRIDSDLKFPEPVAMPLSPLNPRTYDPLPPAPGSAPNDALPPPPPPPAAPAPAPAGPLPAVQEARATANTSPKPLPRIQSQQAVVQSKANTTSFMSDSSFGDGFQITPPSPTQSKPTVAIPEEPAEAPIAPQPRRSVRQSQALGLGVNVGNANRLSMSLRPLPPDDPNENAEQRANRIRSFYKEYFDDSKPEPASNIYDDYYEDYTSEYLDGTVFDPQTGSFVVAHAQGPQAPFAQPVTRRAMTPPPRAPPRFRSGTGPRGAHASNSSMASSAAYPPRNMSSMSGRMGPRKPLPPPSALNALPTPSQLKDDTALFNAMDFAPPVSFRDRQNGMRPDSPLGGSRPFSPAFRPATPLASSYDDLAVMPSPHLLRNSGTFTALDFVPPPRLRDPGSNASDAGSIRSNRSGMSQAGRIAIRNGAYRVSKIPAEMVTTKDDLASQLRPQMSLVR